MLKSMVFKLLMITILVFLPFCEEEEQQSPGQTENWLIPQNEVRDGGPGKDGIVAISRPSFINLEDVAYLSDNDLVVGIRIGEVARAFPHPILDHHEIINYGIDGTMFSLSYCPLTGTAMAWNTNFQTRDSTFGVSGLLYNSNLILYDRQTDSNWSQMLMRCVNGELIGRDAELIPVVETTWRTWKQMFPSSQVMSSDTGFNNDYQIYPYGNYKTSDSLIFPVSNDDERLPKKERVHGVVVNGRAKVYPIANMSNPLQVVNDEFSGIDLVVVGGAGTNLAVSFSRRLDDGTVLTFSASPVALPLVLQDQEGGLWDVFGRCVEGPRQGSFLTPLRSFTGYWFAWAAFYPGAEIYGQSAASLSVQQAVRGVGHIGLAAAADDTRTFSRMEISSRFFKDWRRMMRESRFYPGSDGLDGGVHLDHISPSGLLGELGLQAGDIVRSINGFPLGPHSRFTALAPQLVRADSFKLEIERRGIPMTLVVVLE
jgi:hypothetical protein